MRLLLAALVLQIATAFHALAGIGCDVDKFTVHFGDDVNVNVRAHENEPCIFNQNWSSDAVVTSYKILQRATNGIAGVYMQRSWGYKPNLNFIGTDRFVIEFTGHGTVHSGTSHMFMQVQVLPN